MTINHDRTYINPDKELLVAGGYAEERIQQIRICFQYTEKQKEENLRNAERPKTKQQENTYYKKAYTMRSEYIRPVLCRLAEVFKIHQFSPYDTTRYNSRNKLGTTRRMRALYSIDARPFMRFSSNIIKIF